METLNDILEDDPVNAEFYFENNNLYIEYRFEKYTIEDLFIPKRIAQFLEDEIDENNIVVFHVQATEMGASAAAAAPQTIVNVAGREFHECRQG